MEMYLRPTSLAGPAGLGVMCTAVELELIK